MNEETPDERRSTLTHKCYINPSYDVVVFLFSVVFSLILSFLGVKHNDLFIAKCEWRRKEAQGSIIRSLHINDNSCEVIYLTEFAESR